MKKNIFPLMIIFAVSSFTYGQTKPEEKGFDAYKIETLDDTINFYILNPKRRKKNIFSFMLMVRILLLSR